MDSQKLQRRLIDLQNVATAVGWTALFIYSIWLLVESLTGGREASILYLLLPFPLLLVSIRAALRYSRVRRSHEQQRDSFGNV